MGKQPRARRPGHQYSCSVADSFFHSGFPPPKLSIQFPHREFSRIPNLAALLVFRWWQLFGSSFFVPCISGVHQQKKVLARGDTFVETAIFPSVLSKKQQRPPQKHHHGCFSCPATLIFSWPQKHRATPFLDTEWKPRGAGCARLSP